MRAVLINPPESFLAERHRLGADRWDEMWEGVLHMIPPPSGQHQIFGTELVSILRGQVRSLGLVASYETDVFRPGAELTDYRIPDLVITRPEVRTSRGVEGPPDVVVELLSPEDESRDKLPFYEAMGTKEVLLIDPESRAVELHVLRGGKLHIVLPDSDGGLRSEVLGVRFVPASGPKLRVELPGGTEEL